MAPAARLAHVRHLTCELHPLRLITALRFAVVKIEMEFDDSFFEDSDEYNEGNQKPTEKLLYAVKRCEPEVSLS